MGITKISLDFRKTNSLLKRDEFSGTVEFEGPTPSKSDLANALAKELGTNPELLVIDSIRTSFGASLARFEGKLYQTKESLDAVEPKPKKKEAKPAEKAKG